VTVSRTATLNPGEALHGLTKSNQGTSTLPSLTTIASGKSSFCISLRSYPSGTRLSFVKLSRATLIHPVAQAGAWSSARVDTAGATVVATQTSQSVLRMDDTLAFLGQPTFIPGE
jgi:hypothetical protein